MDGFAAFHFKQLFAMAGALCHALLFQCNAFGFSVGKLGVKLGEEGRELDFAGGEGGPGAAHDVLRHAHAFGDIEAAGFAGKADLQMVGGLEREFVETHAGVQHRLGVGSVDFQSCQMGGRDGETTSGTEMIDEGDSESAAFIGVGRGADFVEEDQRIRGDVEGHFAEARDVG